jgi:peptide/nickel transport system substrate-binding protein
MRQRLLGVILVGIVLVSGIAGCTASSGSGHSSSAGSTLVVVDPAAVPSLNSQQLSTDAQSEVLQNVGEPLLRYAPTSQKVGGLPADSASQFVGGVCAKVVYSTDRIRCTLGHFVSPYGNVLTSEDVKWTFQFLVSQKANGLETMQISNINTENPVTIINSSSFYINLVGADSTTEPSLTFFLYSPLDAVEIMKHATKKDPWATAWLADHTAMFGPYTVSNFVPNQSVTLVKNPHYKGNPAADVPAPTYDTIIYRTVPSAGTRAELLASGAAQLTHSLNEDLYSPLKSVSSVGKYRLPYNAATVIDFNVKSAPYNNEDFRLAIACAVNKAQIVASVYDNQWPVAHTLIDSLTPGYSTAYEPCAKPDLTKAKQYLKESGYTGGTVRLYYTDSITGSDQGDAATLIQAQLAQIGLQVSPQSVPDSGTFFSGAGSGRYGMFLFFYGNNVPTAEWTLGTWYGPGSSLDFTGYTTPQLVNDMSVIKTAPLLSSTATSATGNVQKLLVGGAVVVPIALGEYTFYVSNKVCGLREDPSNKEFWQYLHPCS